MYDPSCGDSVTGENSVVVGSIVGTCEGLNVATVSSVVGASEGSIVGSVVWRDSMVGSRDGTEETPAATRWRVKPATLMLVSRVQSR